MIKRALLILLLFPFISYGQAIDNYFEKIRTNSVELTAFFSQMPKGGDLHHHYSGSVYAETYISYVIDKDYFINENTLEVKKDISLQEGKWARFSSLRKKNLLDGYKQKLIQKWSVKDYNNVDYPSDKQFFETFSHFGMAEEGTIKEGLLEIKQRAKNENVSYIETMFQLIPCDKHIQNTNITGQLQTIQINHDISALTKIFDSLYQSIHKNKGTDCAITFNQWLEKIHGDLRIDNAGFTMRYQNYVLRILDPASVFESLIIAFESAEKSPLIVGVNIVAPEDNEISMRDYWLHMQMFNYCHSKYPTVKYSMHAGELALGLVKPEELTWHINSAIYDAHASRIGHGVDIAYEKDCYDLLNYMQKNNIPIEINLYSNEFILKIKDDRHPITLYKKFKVPIVICSDDAGVLRSNLTDQYVLLASRYKEFNYAEIKKIVFNSIEYSFIEDMDLKNKILADLTIRFEKFEKNILENIKN